MAQELNSCHICISCSSHCWVKLCFPYKLLIMYYHTPIQREKNLEQRIKLTSNTNLTHAVPWNLARPRTSPLKLLTYLTPYMMIGLRRMCARANTCVCSRDVPGWPARLRMEAQSCSHWSSSREYWSVSASMDSHSLYRLKNLTRSQEWNVTLTLTTWNAVKPNYFICLVTAVHIALFFENKETKTTELPNLFLDGIDFHCFFLSYFYGMLTVGNKLDKINCH